MPQTFPFTKANLAGWSPGQKITSVQINTIDANAAQAADGLVWSDIALVKSFTKATVTGGGVCVFWDAFSKRWINGWTSGGGPAAIWSYGSGDWLSLTIPAGTNWGSTFSGASNGIGSMILGGGGGSATASKIRQSSDGGATWTARNTNASGTESALCAVWHSGSSVFIVGLSSPSTTNIETSPDGITWTAQTAPSAARSALASSGSLVVCLAVASSGTCVTSPDAITWTSRTLPSSATWNAVAWNARSGKFMALGPSVIATSADGITWSASGLTAPFNNATWSITTYGRMWIAIGSNTGPINFISVSTDDGVTWTPVCSLAGAGAVLGTGDNQVIAAIGSSVYTTTRGGL